MIKSKTFIFWDGLLHTRNSEGHILMYLISLIIPLVFFLLKEYRLNVLPNVF